MKHTVHNTQVLRKLDMTVYGGSPAAIDTQFGEIVVRKALTPGYIAEIGGNEFLPDAYAYGLTPSIAFLNLGEILKREEAETKAANVVAFPLAA